MAQVQDIAATRAFGAGVDFGRTAADYRRYRAGFPQAFFDRLRALGWATPGERALDLGTGTGTVARGLAGLGLQVTGIDPAAPLLAQAQTMDREAGLVVSYRVGSAEALTEADGSADLVTAGQCWHWFDRPRAAAQAMRVLVPGGRIIIAHFDWLPIAANVVAMTEAVILAHNPRWSMGGGCGIYPAWLADLTEAGFNDIETFSFDVRVGYSHAAWRGRIRASAAIQASLASDEIARFDADLAAHLRARFPDDPLAVPHRVWAVSGRKAERADLPPACSA